MDQAAQAEAEVGRGAMQNRERKSSRHCKVFWREVGASSFWGHAIKRSGSKKGEGGRQAKDDGEGDAPQQRKGRTTGERTDDGQVGGEANRG